MKKSIKLTVNMKKYLFINLIFMMVSAAVVCAQNSEGEDSSISNKNAVYQVKNDLYAKNSRVDMMNEKTEGGLPGVGSKLDKIAKNLIHFLADEESSAVHVVFTDNKNLQSFALTSSFINDQLIGGMKLEFHANPMEGQGALLFRKTF